MNADGAVRALIPPERISESRIRDLLRADCELDRWSRSAPGALRPARLAAEIRDRIWEGHVVSLGAIRARLADRPDGQLFYRMNVDVDVGGRSLTMVSRTRFAVTPRGSVSAGIELTVAGRTGSITGSPILLRPVRQ